MGYTVGKHVGPPAWAACCDPDDGYLDLDADISYPSDYPAAERWLTDLIKTRTFAEFDAPLITEIDDALDITAGLVDACAALRDEVNLSGELDVLEPLTRDLETIYGLVEGTNPDEHARRAVLAICSATQAINYSSPEDLVLFGLGDLVHARDAAARLVDELEAARNTERRERKALKAERDELAYWETEQRVHEDAARRLAEELESSHPVPTPEGATEAPAEPPSGQRRRKIAVTFAEGSSVADLMAPFEALREKLAGIAAGALTQWQAQNAEQLKAFSVAIVRHAEAAKRAAESRRKIRCRKLKVRRASQVHRRLRRAACPQASPLRANSPPTPRHVRPCIAAHAPPPCERRRLKRAPVGVR